MKLCLSPALVTSRSRRQMLSLAIALTAIPLFAQQSATPPQAAAGKPVAKPAIKAYVLAPTPPPTHKMGPLQININWRQRTEDWNWFKGNTGNSDYVFWDSLLRIGIGHRSRSWKH